jgi:hypothetical protein
MDIKAEITQIEAAMKRRGVTIRALCDAAQINSSTWTRWKSGANGPTLMTWSRVTAALGRLEGAESKQDAA